VEGPQSPEKLWFGYKLHQAKGSPRENSKSKWGPISVRGEVTLTGCQGNPFWAAGLGIWGLMAGEERSHRERDSPLGAARCL
jgi:hypothetical protein